MKAMVRFFIGCLLGLSAHTAHAEVVGGYMDYSYFSTSGGEDIYEFHLTLFRDCTKEDPFVPETFDKSVSLCIYKQNGAFFKELSFSTPQIEKATPTYAKNACGNVSGICLEKAVYSGFVSVPSGSGGHYIRWVRCCSRIGNNHFGTDELTTAGVTYRCFIPGGVKNNSTKLALKSVPVICPHDTARFSFAMPGLDPDGDSVSYEIVRPYIGGSSILTTPECEDTMRMPNELMNYKSGYSFDHPFGFVHDQCFAIDAQTGELQMMSRNTGKYTIAIELKEWRSGAVINTTRIDQTVYVLEGKVAGGADIAANGWKVFPNPANDIVFVEAQSTEALPWQLTDIGGRIVLCGKGIPQAGIDISSLNAGQYYLQVRGNVQQTLKLVVCR